MSGLLHGDVAVVTGGGAGIGRAISERFAAEGAHVVVAEVDDARLDDLTSAIEANGGAVTGVRVDVRDEGAVDATFAAADAVGGATVLVNNVGHYGGGRGAFHTQARDEWDALYRVNLAHVLAFTQRAIRSMVERDVGGRIVSISTIEAFRAIPTRAVYSAFKAGITALTKSLAVEYGAQGIRVNAIAPDVTETEQVPYSRWLSPSEIAGAGRWVPVGRFGTGDDIARVALFLASDLSQFVTGTTVHADGGTLASSGWFPTEDGGWTNRPQRA